MSSSVTRNVYKDYGSYLRSRGFDKQVCDYLTRIMALEEGKANLEDGNDFIGPQRISGELSLDSSNGIVDVSFIRFSNGSILNLVDVSNLNITEKYDKTGGVLTGDIDLSNNKIFNVNEIGFVGGANFLSIDTDNSNNIRLLGINDVIIQGDDNLILKSTNGVAINKDEANSALDISGLATFNSGITLEKQTIDKVGELVLINEDDLSGILHNNTYTTSKIGYYDSYTLQPVPSYKVDIDSDIIDMPLVLEKRTMYKHQYYTTSKPNDNTYIIAGDSILRINFGQDTGLNEEGYLSKRKYDQIGLSTTILDPLPPNNILYSDGTVFKFNTDISKYMFEVYVNAEIASRGNEIVTLGLEISGNGVVIECDCCTGECICNTYTKKLGIASITDISGSTADYSNVDDEPTYTVTLGPYTIEPGELCYKYAYCFRLRNIESNITKTSIHVKSTFISLKALLV